MSNKWLKIGQAVLAAAAAPIYAPGTLKQAVVHTASAYNPGTDTVILSVYLVSSGGTAGASNTVSRTPVPGGATVPVPDIYNLKIVNPDSLHASGNGLTLTLTGAEADVA